MGVAAENYAQLHAGHQYELAEKAQLLQIKDH